MSTDTTLTSPTPTIVLPIQPINPGSSDMSESDRRTLRRALGVIKAARADAKSKDPKVAGPAARRLVNVLCYVAGFLDGKGQGTALYSGFLSIYQLYPVVGTDLEAQLDEFQKSLEEVLQPGSTRSTKLTGALLIALGILLKQL
jgi:hypothetical protein